MAIYLYEKKLHNNGMKYKMVKEVPIAGRNFIYKMWLKRGEPKNSGWEIEEKDIIKYFEDEVLPTFNPSIIIDFNPKGKDEITLVELKHIYAFTYADEKTLEVWWTPILPIMLEIVPDVPFVIGNTPQERKSIISEFAANNYDREMIEFLYLQGEKRGWNWGMVGRVNGALIFGKARDFFKTHI